MTKGFSKRQVAIQLNLDIYFFNWGLGNPLLGYVKGGLQSSRPRVISPEVMSPETWVVLPEILVMSPEKKSKALFVSDDTKKILKALFVPNNKGERCSFPTTKCSVVRLVCNRFLLTDVS